MFVLYETACEHLFARDPRITNLSQEFRCRTCNQMTRITGVQIMEYRAKCKTCNWTRYAGMSSQVALGAGRRHMQNNPGHVVNATWAVNPHAKAERERIEKGKLI